MYIGVTLLHLSRQEMMETRAGEFFDLWAVFRVSNVSSHAPVREQRFPHDGVE